MDPGDVIFVISQKPHARFTRREQDLIYKAEIELVTALAGGTIYIEHLDDRWLAVDILPGEAIAPGTWTHDGDARGRNEVVLTGP